MAYVPVPKDLTKVKTKVMFNLTRRQLVCFTAGALVGVPLFFLLRVILSILVDTFSSRISLTMPPSPKPHNTACVLS